MMKLRTSGADAVQPEFGDAGGASNVRVAPIRPGCGAKAPPSTKSYVTEPACAWRPPKAKTAASAMGRMLIKYLPRGAVQVVAKSFGATPFSVDRSDCISGPKAQRKWAEGP